MDNMQVLLTRGIQLRGEDASDTSLFSTYNAAFLAGANAAVMDLWKRLGHVQWDDVALDAARQFDIDDSDFAYDVGQMLQVSDNIDFTASANYVLATEYDYAPIGPKTYVVPGARENQTVYVKYIPIPAELVNPYPVTVGGHAAGESASVPANIPDAYSDAIVYMGLAEISSTLGDSTDDIAKWTAKYFQIADDIASVKGKKRIVNKREY